MGRIPGSYYQRAQIIARGSLLVQSPKNKNNQRRGRRRARLGVVIFTEVYESLQGKGVFSYSSSVLLMVLHLMCSTRTFPCSHCPRETNGRRSFFLENTSSFSFFFFLSPHISHVYIYIGSEFSAVANSLLILLLAADESKTLEGIRARPLLWLGVRPCWLSGHVKGSSSTPRTPTFF